MDGEFWAYSCEGYVMSKHQTLEEAVREAKEWVDTHGDQDYYCDVLYVKPISRFWYNKSESLMSEGKAFKDLQRDVKKFS